MTCGLQNRCSTAELRQPAKDCSAVRPPGVWYPGGVIRNAGILALAVLCGASAFAKPARRSTTPELAVPPHAKLKSGKTIEGALACEAVTIRTEWGLANVPVARIVSVSVARIREGEREGFDQRVRDLARQLGSNAFAERQRAREVLAGYGGACRAVLEKFTRDPDPEIQATVQDLIET